MVAEAPGQEENLEMETPAGHVVVEVGEVRVLIHDFVVGLPSQPLAEQRGERRLSRPDVPAHRDKPLHTDSPPSRATDAAARYSPRRAAPTAATIAATPASPWMSNRSVSTMTTGACS